MIQEGDEADTNEAADSQDALNDYNLTTLDNATLVALYETLCEEPEDTSEPQEDFPKGQ